MQGQQVNSSRGFNEKTLLDLLRGQGIDPQRLVNFYSDSIDVARTFNSLTRESIGEIPYLKRELDANHSELFLLRLKEELCRDQAINC